jgi:hypothetical protein
MLLLINKTQYIIYNLETLSEMFRYDNTNIAIELNNMSIIVHGQKDRKINTKIFRIVDIEDENKCYICKKYTDRKTALIPCLCTKYCEDCLPTLNACVMCKKTASGYGKIN